MMVGLKFRRTPYSFKTMVTPLPLLPVLKHWNRELTAGEEARLLTVHRDQVWFGQLAEGAFLAQHSSMPVLICRLKMNRFSAG